jgi:hypothetical protein
MQPSPYGHPLITKRASIKLQPGVNCSQFNIEVVILAAKPF